MLLSGLLTLIVSTIALRTIDDYFIICTLGIPGIPSIQFFGIGIESKPAFLLLTLFFVALFFFFLKKLTGSSFGRTLLALSEDEIFAQSLGKNVYLAKANIGRNHTPLQPHIYVFSISFLITLAMLLAKSK
jgi:branched-chain amino acid transport system permease protein